MRTHQNLCLSLAVGMLCILPGCGSSDNLAPTTITTTKAALIGTLDGDLADNTALQFDLAAYTGDPSMPLIIGETVWNDELSARIKTVFDAGRPVVLVNATADEVNALRKIVGLSGDVVFPDNVTYVDFYGVDRNPQGDTYVTVIYPPEASKDTQETYSLDTTNEIATLVNTQDVITSILNTEFTQQQQVADIAAWVAQDTTRDTSPIVLDEVATSALKSALKSADTTLLGTYDIAQIAKATEITYVFPHYTNRHQIRNIVWGVHDVNRNEDIFYVRQEGTFSASQEVYVDIYQHRAFYATRYMLTNSVVGALDNNALVQTLASLPHTYEDKIKVSSGMDYKLDGDFGLSAKADKKGISGGGDIGVSGSIGFKSSIQFDVPDAVVTNKSGGHLNDTVWDFSIRRPYYVWNPACVLFGLGEIPNLGKGTFLPKTEWIWRASADMRKKSPDGLPVLTEFYAETGRSLLPASGLINPTVCWAILENRGTSGLKGRMTVPWPPVTATTTPTTR